MAEGLSAVAAKAFPRAVANGSWSAMRMPNPKRRPGRSRTKRRRSHRSGFILMVRLPNCSSLVWVVGLTTASQQPFLKKPLKLQERIEPMRFAGKLPQSGLGRRQGNADDTRFVRAFGSDFNFAAVRFDNLARHRQAQPQTHVAGGEKRLDGALGGLLRETRSGIPYFNPHPPPAGIHIHAAANVDGRVRRIGLQSVEHDL